MAKVYVTQAAGSGGSGGNLQLLNGAAMDATLRAVSDTANTASPLKLSTGGVQTTTKLQITTADTNYIDAEDNSGNNRFTVGRDPSSQQVNVDFASNPGGSTELVGGFRTYVDGTNLSNVVNIRRDGQLQIGSTAASAMYWDNTNNRVGIGTATPGVKLDVHSGADNIAQLNRTGAGKSLLQYLLTGTARWATGFDNTNGNYTIYDAVNATDRVVVTNTGRLGVGTNAPSAKVYIQGTDSATAGSHLIIQGTGTAGFAFADYSGTNTYSAIYPSGVSPASRSFTNYLLISNLTGTDVGVNSQTQLNLTISGSNRLSAFANGIAIPNRLSVGQTGVDTNSVASIKGSGSTSATTSLLVQNSGGNNALQIRDDRVIIMAGLPTSSAGLPTGALWNNLGVLSVA